MTTALPCIALRSDPQPALMSSARDDVLANLVTFLAATRGDADRRVGEMLAALVAEGRQFRKTESGRRWQSVLAESQLAAKGWMLWSMLDLDRHLTGRDLDAPNDTPSAMIDELLHQISAVKLEQLAAIVGVFAEPQGAGRG